MTKMTSQQGFFIIEAVERSSDEAKAQHDAEEKRVKEAYIRRTGEPPYPHVHINPPQRAISLNRAV